MNRAAALARETPADPTAMLEAVASVFHGPRIAIACEPSLNLAPGQSAAIEEIVRESLSNGVRHAFVDGRADRRIWLSLSASDGRARLAVRDNGVGFPELSQTPCPGLDRIGALAQALGGFARLDNRNYGGAEVTVVFPVTSQGG